MSGRTACVRADLVPVHPRVIANMWKRVERGPDTDSCWQWMGNVNARGYGRFGASYVAHRIALASVTGGVKPKAMACHHCDNRLCCNPVHLYWGDAKTNAADRSLRGREGDRSLKKNGRFVDIAGQKFGRLLAVSLIETQFKGHMARWKCQCDCGKIYVVRGPALRNGNTRSCGCLNDPYRLARLKKERAKCRS